MGSTPTEEDGGRSMKMKELTIKSRVIITIVAIFLASSAVMAFVTYTSQMNQMKESITEKVKNDLKLFPSQVQADADGLGRALAGFSEVESIMEPFAERTGKNSRQR